MSIRTLKRKLDRIVSKYIRARDTNRDGYCICCTCNRLKLPSECDAGHYLGKGLGGASGIRYDERNIHAQCRQCNRFGGQRTKEAYREFMIKKYSQVIIDELKIKDKTHRYSLFELEGLLIYYKEEHKRLKEKQNETKK